jgi:hypothetical protein
VISWIGVSSRSSSSCGNPRRLRSQSSACSCVSSWTSRSSCQLDSPAVALSAIL